MNELSFGPPTLLNGEERGERSDILKVILLILKLINITIIINQGEGVKAPLFYV